MKKLVTMVTASLLLITSAFAAGDPGAVSEKVKAEFERKFTAAKNVTWEKTEEFYFAKFELNSCPVEVAYNENAELVAVLRTIETSQLPLNVMLAIADRYSGYKVAVKAQEITLDGETKYYLSIENDTRILKLKCSTGGDIQVESKLKKAL